VSSSTPSQAGLRESAECHRHLPKPTIVRLVGLRRGAGEKKDVRLQEMAADFSGAGLQVLFRVMELAARSLKRRTQWTR
jgi:hypothetical protein